MSKAAKINKAINWGIWIAGAYFIGTAIAGAIKRRREGTNGIGKVERIKRRVYKEVSLAQGRGVDFSKKFADLTKAEKDALKHIGNEVGWKQSKRAIDSGKSYVESYYNSLRRAWNAVSGIVGIGKAYDVKDANGNVCLTWIEDAAAHVKHEQEIEEKRRHTEELEAKLRKQRNAMRRRTAHPETIPADTIIRKSKQQQILDKFPYLKIMDDPNRPIQNSTAFTMVLWKTLKNEWGELLYEGPAMAFTNRASAEDAKAFLKKDFTKIKTDVWNDYIDKLRERLLEEDRNTPRGEYYFSKYDAFYTEKEPATLTIKDVSKVKLDDIAGIYGIGYEAAHKPFWYGIPAVQFISHGEWGDPEIYYKGEIYNAVLAENELYQIWREQIEYEETNKSFEDWMRSAGGEFLKKEVLPYMPSEVDKLFHPKGYFDNDQY